MTYDVEYLKESNDCRLLIETDLGAPKHRSYKYNLYPCPLHNEKHGESLCVYQDGWICRGKCNKSGSVIDWLVQYRGLDFKSACEVLGGKTIVGMDGRKHSRPRRPAAWEEPAAEPPSAEWQANARRVIEAAVDTLWSAAGAPALRYLTQQRGLDEITIAAANLGYIPGHFTEWKELIPGWRKTDGSPVKVPCGIVIPHFADGHLWAVRVRRAAGDVKYVGISGGSKALYWSDHVKPITPVMITEGEFDALIAWQVARQYKIDLSPVALASASNKKINRRWWAKLTSAPSILTRVDDDDAGRAAITELKKLSRAVFPVQVSIGKDVTDYYLACGGYELAGWMWQLEGVQW